MPAFDALGDRSFTFCRRFWRQTPTWFASRPSRDVDGCGRFTFPAGQVQLRTTWPAAKRGPRVEKRRALFARVLARATARGSVVVPRKLKKLKFFGIKVNFLLQLSVLMDPEQPERGGLLCHLGGELVPE